MDIYHLRPSDALEKVQQALSLKPEADHLYSMVVLQYTRATATVAIGDSESALESGRDSVPLAEKLRHRTWLGRAMSGNLFVTRARGDWAQARSYSDRGLEASPRDVRLLGPRALLERDLGDFEQGQIYIDRFVSLWDINNSTPTIEYCLSVCTIAMVARITGDARMFNKIQATADMTIALNAVTPLVETFSRIAKGIIAVIQEDAVTAKQQYDALGLIRGMFPYLIAGDRVLGLLCSTMGDMDRASDHFEDALTFCRKADYRPELAWTCCDYATTLLRRNNYGDSEKAATLLGLLCSTMGDMDRASDHFEDALTFCRKADYRPELAWTCCDYATTLLRRNNYGDSRRILGPRKRVRHGTSGETGRGSH